MNLISALAIRKAYARRLGLEDADFSGHSLPAET
jgi:hypothetical protein